MSLVRGLKYIAEGEGGREGGREGDMSLVRGFKYISEGEGGGYESGQGTKHGGYIWGREKCTELEITVTRSKKLKDQKT